jgi:glucokinase
MAATSGILAVDIGGTKLAAAVVTAQGDIIRRDRVATPNRAPWVTLAALIKRIQATASDIELVACGVACGGPMKIGGTEVSPLHIPTWVDFPLLSSISELTGLRTFIDNDAKALALAEGWLGATRDCANFLAVVIGTGVGGGLVEGNRLAVGRTGNAGHFGHIVVGSDDRPCRCGGRGCLEAYVSGPAIERETGRDPMFAPMNLKVRNGILLGRAVASVAAVADIERVVVGGSVALGWGEPFFQAANDELGSRSKLQFTSGVSIVPLGLGDSSALIGAAAVALTSITERTASE